MERLLNYPWRCAYLGDVASRGREIDPNSLYTDYEKEFLASHLRRLRKLRAQRAGRVHLMG